MLLVYNRTDSATWNPIQLDSDEHCLLQNLMKEIMGNVIKKMLIVIQILRIICPREEAYTFQCHLRHLANGESSIILHGFEKTQNKIRRLKNALENIVCTPRLPPTSCAMQCIPSIPAIGLLTLTGAENKHTEP